MSMYACLLACMTAATWMCIIRTHRLHAHARSPSVIIRVRLWASERVCGAQASLQNLLELAVTSLRAIPEYGQREVVLVYGSITTCDPADIFDTIAKLVKCKVRVRRLTPPRPGFPLQGDRLTCLHTHRHTHARTHARTHTHTHTGRCRSSRCRRRCTSAGGWPRTRTAPTAWPSTPST
jgi:hypothetical protein